ncbi:MAG: hypothetical protein ACRC9R_06495, partial [Enterovibrio sp.]
MQTRATTGSAIAALRNLLRGDPSQITGTAAAAPSFQVLAVRLTAATPQTNQPNLNQELSTLAARDPRFSQASNLIRSALQSY